MIAALRDMWTVTLAALRREWWSALLAALCIGLAGIASQYDAHIAAVCMGLCGGLRLATLIDALQEETP